MCGIAGRVDHAGPAHARLVAAMTHAIAHRGPDDDGLLVRGSCALGHRRLSIVDRSGGHQPLSNEDGTVWVVFNGEIYNHADIRRDLEARGHVFKTRSDTEVIVHAYEEDGARCVERFRGMFAFAIWDAPRRRLVLGRDRLGIKPIYYAAASNHLSFASELRALCLDPSVDRTVDDDALSCYLALRYVPAPRTLLRGVKKLPPATVLVWEDGRVRLERYWDLASMPTRDENPPTEAEAAIELRELMDDCVQMRLMSEVPLGTFLSGGIDSTAITASILARRGSTTESEKGPLRTFSVGYSDNPEQSELRWAALAARELGTLHTEIPLPSDEAARAVPEILWGLDEPVADPAAVPLWFLSKRTRQDVTVVLSGEGGDEILAGYSTYRWMTQMQRLSTAAPLFGLASRLLPSTGKLARLQRAAHLASLPLEERYRGVSRAFDDLGRHAALGSDDDSAVARALAPHWEATRGMSPLRRMLYLDTSVWLPDDLLMKADKMTMATAVELRVPLLDHKMVEFAWSMPDRYKLRGSEAKRLLRRAVRGRVPQAILDRPKQGFATPTGPWLRGALSELLRSSVLESPHALSRERLDLGVVRRMIDEHARGLDRSPELWTLLCLEVWHARLRTMEPFVEAMPGAESPGAELPGVMTPPEEPQQLEIGTEALVAEAV